LPCKTGVTETVKELFAPLRAWLQSGLTVPLCRFNSLLEYRECVNEKRRVGRKNLTKDNKARLISDRNCFNFLTVVKALESIITGKISKMHLIKRLFQITVLAFVFTLVSPATTVTATSAKRPYSDGILTGIASFYAAKFEGRLTATGEVFKQKLFTAASNLYKLNTWVRVTNLRNGKSVIVRVNDRMHPNMLKLGRVIDLSHTAAKSLEMTGHGLQKVKVERVPVGTRG
jgi:rare lipoprotein A